MECVLCVGSNTEHFAAKLAMNYQHRGGNKTERHKIVGVEMVRLTRDQNGKMCSAG